MGDTQTAERKDCKESTESKDTTETKDSTKTKPMKDAKDTDSTPTTVSECLACYSEPALCELRPCLHHVMCLRCTVSLEAAICPACRCSVQAILPLDAISNGVSTCTTTDTTSEKDDKEKVAPIAFAEIQRVRSVADEAALDSTLQIVFAAVPSARAECQALIDAAIAAYPADGVGASGSVANAGATSNASALSLTGRSARPAFSGLVRLLEASRRALSSTSTSRLLAKQASANANANIAASDPASDLARKLPLPAPFAANVCISGRRARLTLFALPAIDGAGGVGTADVRAVAGLLRARRPDYVFMAAQGACTPACEWDARLRSVLGAAELPRRTWLLVGAKEPRAAAQRAAGDVAHALESCPPRERPASVLRVCQPVADHPRATLRFVRSALRHAARARAAASACAPTMSLAPASTPAPAPQLQQSSNSNTAVAAASTPGAATAIATTAVTAATITATASQTE